ncbi:DNA primase [Clostridium algidicarnis]|uniref:CHC2 zinc finger domain-containing protein n=1 Tax=Clostridium algidicarnis TaxID=37659 RepID=UPI001C0DE071|nr:CHC2 zinc finger domain-containing protein [Clostridium algidicarnis]MBU3208708.1 DNA primase [Clostridium algidicarnis]
MNELQYIDLKELIERETGNKFNKEGYVKCPFHNEKTPSLSVRFNSDTNKYQFKCFGCGASGDVIDFIIKYKDMGYIGAREYLGLTVEKTEEEIKIDKIKSYIEWEIERFRTRQELLGIFTFVNANNSPAYYKAKFMDNEKERKVCSYYHIEDDKVIAKRGKEEIPYNLYKTLQAFNNDQVVIIVEGEKDANNLNSTLKGINYQATSFKGTNDFSMLKGGRIYVIPDTGKAGEQYKWGIYKELFHDSKEFKFINLPGINDLGDNKDVTDWLEAGHTKKDLLTAFDRSLNLKDKYEFQQDKGGIYKYNYDKQEDDYKKNYITNFRLLKATRIKFADEDQEGVKLTLKSSTGQDIEKIGPSIVFDDIRTFKNYLGTMDLAFKGKLDELTDLKVWINKYFIMEVEEIYQGVKFTKKDEELIFITNEGAVAKDRYLRNIKSDGRNAVDIFELEDISREELKELKRNIFKFATPEKTISIIGTVINNLAVYQNQELKQKLHHLLIVGESGCGKSTILENVIAPILNYPKKDIRSIGLITPFALIKGLSDGNYSMLFDEFKPSSLDRYKVAKISEMLRNLYDRATISRGDKSLKSRDFQLNRPLIMAGEESYPNQEKALIERSCIIYLSKRERKKQHEKSMGWIIENESILNKFGKSLIKVILELKVEEYSEIRQNVQKDIKGIKNRPLTTAINICCGIEIFNILLEKMGIKKIDGYVGHVTENIKTEILEDGQDTHSTVEQMLILYNDMIEDGRAFNSSDVVKYRSDGIFIKTSEMINQIHEHCSKVGADIIPLKLRDFKKQAQKSGYLTGVSDKVIKVGLKTIRYDTYNMEMLREVKVNSIIPPELEDVSEKEHNIIPFKV